jgi:1,4-dihydroxy-2-naphthoyl-CoA hydrolase
VGQTRHVPDQCAALLHEQLKGSHRSTLRLQARELLGVSDQQVQGELRVGGVILGAADVVQGVRHHKEHKVQDLESLQRLWTPLFPGLMGIELKEASPERAVGTMKVRADLCTTGEVLHGGAIMALADTLGAVGTFQNLPQGAGTTTIDSSTKFIRAARAGSTVTAECTAFHRGRTTMVWQTLVKTEDGKVCAVVTQTQLVTGG